MIWLPFFRVRVSAAKVAGVSETSDFAYTSLLSTISIQRLTILYTVNYLLKINIEKKKSNIAQFTYMPGFDCCLQPPPCSFM